MSVLSNTKFIGKGYTTSLAHVVDNIASITTIILIDKFIK